jgi:hypothetical protein
MKKVFLFAGLCVSAFLSFELFISAVEEGIVVYSNEGGQLPGAYYVSLILGALMLIAAILGIVFTAKMFKKKDGDLDYIIPAILLLVCAGILMLGFLPMQIFNCAQTISYYSQPSGYPYDPDAETAQKLIALSIIFVLLDLVEGLFVTVLAVLSLVKQDTKKSN